MKLIVIGVTGLIGTKVVKGLREKDHEVVAAPPSQGINSITGEGLAEALFGAQQFLSATRDPRTVITDPKALYCGTAINDQSLTPGENPSLRPTRFSEWLVRSAK
jgi:nucleoside-diphosphate-sugar epimerase